MTGEARAGHIAHLNSVALLLICAEYGITFAQHAELWRPTQRTTGDIPGVSDGTSPLGSLTVLCTDGVVAWFLAANGRLFYGHVAQFTGEVRTLYSTQKPQRPTAVRVRKPVSAVAHALTMLEEL